VLNFGLSPDRRLARLHFLAHLWLSLVLGSAKWLNHGLGQKMKSYPLCQKCSIKVKKERFMAVIQSYCVVCGRYGKFPM